jgi:hypothetical protein
MEELINELNLVIQRLFQELYRLLDHHQHSFNTLKGIEDLIKFYKALDLQ